MRTHTCVCARMFQSYVRVHVYAYTGMHAHASVSKTMKDKFLCIKIGF